MELEKFIEIQLIYRLTITDEYGDIHFHGTPIIKSQNFDDPLSGLTLYKKSFYMTSYQRNQLMIAIDEGVFSDIDPSEIEERMKEVLGELPQIVNK